MDNFSLEYRGELPFTSETLKSRELLENPDNYDGFSELAEGEDLASDLEEMDTAHLVTSVAITDGEEDESEYILGEKIYFDDVEEGTNLHWNMETNGWDKVVETRTGNTMPIEEHQEVVEDLPYDVENAINRSYDLEKTS